MKLLNRESILFPVFLTIASLLTISTFFGIGLCDDSIFQQNYFWYIIFIALALMCVGLFLLIRRILTRQSEFIVNNYKNENKS